MISCLRSPKRSYSVLYSFIIIGVVFSTIDTISAFLELLGICMFCSLQYSFKAFTVHLSNSGILFPSLYYFVIQFNC